MTYVALLRGINVGGANKVSMKELKAVFEQAGMTSVRTYINSGNVVFSTKRRGRGQLVETLQRAIAEHFGFEITVVVRDIDKMRSLVGAIPADWRDNQTMRCYVMFLFPDVDRPSIMKQLTIKPDLDDVRYASGAVVWRVDRKNLTKSGMIKLTGIPLYKQMTIRNCNTTRRLLQLMEE
jgi:uncharacterized protein (DUF1697 family)